ncbi:MAG: cation transporter dimerization domain-containing protein, partial [Candidatus Nanopelagicales bacterium]
MPKDASVEETHNMCDHLEQDIAARLSYTNVTIHVEPCNGDCDQCS